MALAATMSAPVQMELVVIISLENVIVNLAGGETLVTKVCKSSNCSFEVWRQVQFSGRC